MNTTKLVIIGAVGVAAVVLLSRSQRATPAAQPGLPSSSGAGGTLSTLGAWFGAASQLVGSYDPTSIGADRTTPVYNPSVVSNPVVPSPAVLPYSYKQAIIDVPGLLGTDDLFTPSYGSSGAYSESGDPGTGAGPTSNSYWA
jgi:hypothetical protein